MPGKKAPSLDNQIKSAKAPKGSALERVIHDNQDFNLLSPEEFDDEVPLPLWLRVAWRKQHPDISMPEKNAGEAYPEVLSQIYERMVANPDLEWGTKPSDDDPSK